MKMGDVVSKAPLKKKQWKAPNVCKWTDDAYIRITVSVHLNIVYQICHLGCSELQSHHKGLQKTFSVQHPAPQKMDTTHQYVTIHNTNALQFTVAL